MSAVAGCRVPATAGFEARLFGVRSRSGQTSAYRAVDFGVDLLVDVGHLAFLFCAKRFPPDRTCSWLIVSMPVVLLVIAERTLDFGVDLGAFLVADVAA